MPFPYGRLIVGTRHCRVLISGNINSDAIGIDINQPLWNRPECLFAPQENSVFVEQARKPVLQNIVKLD